MRQGISTRYLGPTNSRGSRIKAIARKASSFGKEMSLTSPYQYRGTEEEHTIAVKALAAKLAWQGLWVGGGKPEEDGYQFVHVTDTAPLVDDKDYLSGIGYADRDWFYIEKEDAA